MPEWKIDLINFLNRLKEKHLLQLGEECYYFIEEEQIDEVIAFVANDKLIHSPTFSVTRQRSMQLEYNKKNGEYLEFEFFKNSIQCIWIDSPERGDLMFESIGLEFAYELIMEFHKEKI